jgi:DNA-binding FadR family transcriptional regulator
MKWHRTSYFTTMVPSAAQSRSSDAKKKAGRTSTAAKKKVGRTSTAAKKAAERSAGNWAERRVAAQSGRARQTRAKRAEIVAAEIEDDVISQGWPVGLALGSETELMAKYGVSRSVFREAVRLLEHHFVAETRRGRNGGLVVVKPDPAALTDAVALYLRYHMVDPRDLFEAREGLELTCARLAAERATEEDVEHLRHLASPRSESSDVELAANSAAFHAELASVSGNPALHLFVQVLSTLTESTLDHGPARKHADSVHHAHQAIAEAVAAGDGAMAQRRMLRHFEAMAAVGPLTAPAAAPAEDALSTNGAKAIKADKKKTKPNATRS